MNDFICNHKDFYMTGYIWEGEKEKKNIKEIKISF